MSEPTVDPRTLLATADAATLREDAACACAAAKRETGLRTRAALLRLAALADVLPTTTGETDAK